MAADTTQTYMIKLFSMQYGHSQVGGLQFHGTLSMCISVFLKYTFLPYIYEHQQYKLLLVLSPPPPDMFMCKEKVYLNRTTVYKVCTFKKKMWSMLQLHDQSSLIPRNQVWMWDAPFQAYGLQLSLLRTALNPLRGIQKDRTMKFKYVCDILEPLCILYLKENKMLQDMFVILWLGAHGSMAPSFAPMYLQCMSCALRTAHKAYQAFKICVAESHLVHSLCKCKWCKEQNWHHTPVHPIFPAPHFSVYNAWCLHRARYIVTCLHGPS